MPDKHLFKLVALVPTLRVGMQCGRFASRIRIPCRTRSVRKAFPRKAWERGKDIPTQSMGTRNLVALVPTQSMGTRKYRAGREASALHSHAKHGNEEIPCRTRSVCTAFPRKAWERGNTVQTLRVTNPNTIQDAKRPKGIPTQSMGTRKRHSHAKHGNEEIRIPCRTRSVRKAFPRKAWVLKTSQVSQSQLRAEVNIR
ncbi:hypothetical protein [Desulfonema magnum]|uniref:Uncharacterized protein n=1 Tax=Desulfonema magnum TaxID=45655 RepID=A0A975BKE5_9BACT|nr:hypothetical protein [Desulfonema magnum]QTA86748.1 Uncharacterized protein dnm_027720 [Desulfonema magnum]